MVFSSLTFLFIFLPLTLLLYYIVPEKFKNLIVLLASLVFYAWGEPIYIVLMILSILFNYYSGLDIGEHTNTPALARRKLIFAVIVNVAILTFFKYYGFLIDSVNGILPFNIQYRQLPLPIGISFYTFQALSYLIDVYRKNASAQKKFINFALYISMFPQLIAGPIVRYSDIDSQIEYREHSYEKFGSGVIFFIIGLAKKVIIANGLGYVFSQVQAMDLGSFSVLSAWVGCLCYTLHIYFDFSGYSDMAIGLGRMFGFSLRKNFDYPYISKSITEFWRRWHISLGTWFKEYVYIPLGGNRYGKDIQIRNLLIVWALTGLWHGAAWNFLFWGVYYAIILILEKFIWGKSLRRFPKIVQHIYALVLIMIGWVFFFSPSIGEAFSYIGVMFGIGASGFMDKTGLFLISTNWLLIVMGILGSSKRGILLIRTTYEGFKSQRTRAIVATVVYTVFFFITLTFLATESFNPFLYFRF